MSAPHNHDRGIASCYACAPLPQDQKIEQAKVKRMELYSVLDDFGVWFANIGDGGTGADILELMDKLAKRNGQ